VWGVWGVGVWVGVGGVGVWGGVCRVCGVCGTCGVCGVTFDIPQTAFVATLDTYDFIFRDK
jgi:hypothetical protein